MIGWKQAYTLDRRNIVLVKLYVPDISVFAPGKAWMRKNGCVVAKEATVMEITSIDGKHHFQEAASMKDGRFRYQVGKTIRPRIDQSIGDAPEIYFFESKQKAIDYEY